MDLVKSDHDWGIFPFLPLVKWEREGISMLPRAVRIFLSPFLVFLYTRRMMASSRIVILSELSVHYMTSTVGTL